jgi:hypothetical protein
MSESKLNILVTECKTHVISCVNMLIKFDKLSIMIQNTLWYALCLREKG